MNKPPNADLNGRLIRVARFPRLQFCQRPAMGCTLRRIPVDADQDSKPIDQYHMAASGCFSPGMASSPHGEECPDSAPRSRWLPRARRAALRRLVGTVPGAIVTLRPGETEFRPTHAIVWGTAFTAHRRSLPAARFAGGDADNPTRDEVHIYASTDAGATWSVAYTSERCHSPHPQHRPRSLERLPLDLDWRLRRRMPHASCHLRPQPYRGRPARPAAGPCGRSHSHANGLYFSSDTPLEHNYIYRLDLRGELVQVAPISCSSIYGCRVGNRVFFSTMVEPSEVNRDRYVRVYSGAGVSPKDWHLLLG